jgi:hypothetical protein
LSCEVRKAGAKPILPSQAPDETNAEIEAKVEVEEKSPEKNKEPQKCPFSDCEVMHVRSALMKRHLFEAHNIQNVSVQLPNLEAGKKAIKEEPQSETEEEPHKSEQAPAVEVDDRKVPPLRVKLSGLAAKKPVQTPKTTLRCELCNSFQSNNAYIFNRHQTCCRKKSMNKEEADKPAPVEKEQDENVQEQEAEEPKEDVSEAVPDEQEKASENNEEVKPVAEDPDGSISDAKDTTESRAEMTEEAEPNVKE